MACSSDDLCAQSYADSYIEYTRLTVDSVQSLAGLDHYGLVWFSRRPRTLEAAQRLAAALPEAIERWKRIDVKAWHAEHVAKRKLHDQQRATLSREDFDRWVRETYPNVPMDDLIADWHKDTQ